MKKNEVQLGGVYKCKVSGNIVSVKITHENPHGGWDAINLKTGKSIRVKSAQRLRGAVNRPATRKKIVSLAEYEAEAKAEHAAFASGKAKDTTPAKQCDTGQRGGKGTEPAPQPGDNAKPLSLIRAAVCVLQSCERPMSCNEIVTKAMDAKIWAPRNGGLTPANTLSAAIRREIKTKGDTSRFVMAERGKFELAK